ncbi:MAG: hypothetical protein ACYS0C_01885 [Planctomycetota bacterium]
MAGVQYKVVLRIFLGVVRPPFEYFGVSGISSIPTITKASGVNYNQLIQRFGNMQPHLRYKFFPSFSFTMEKWLEKSIVGKAMKFAKI